MGLLSIEPLTYIRGRSIPNQYLIVDDALGYIAGMCLQTRGPKAVIVCRRSVVSWFGTERWLRDVRVSLPFRAGRASSSTHSGCGTGTPACG